MFHIIGYTDNMYFDVGKDYQGIISMQSYKRSKGFKIKKKKKYNKKVIVRRQKNAI